MTALSAPDLEVGGPRGTVRGREVLGPWLTRAGLRATPLRWSCGADGTVVVEQDAVWADPSTGAERGRAVVASRFAVAAASSPATSATTRGCRPRRPPPARGSPTR